MKKWQFQKAKAELSQLVRLTKEDGPQIITLHGTDTVVVLSIKDYKKLVKPKPRFVDFMKKSPLAGTDLKITRDKSLTREIDL